MTCYENRFVYHLIQRLFAFVDKRTDVIFWSTGDETCNTMSMESKVDDAYEEISYKIEMTIKNRQSYVENDSDHMEVFKRIDRLRRMVTELKRAVPSASIMARLREGAKPDPADQPDDEGPGATVPATSCGSLSRATMR